MTSRVLARIIVVPAVAAVLFACGGSSSTPAASAPAPAAAPAEMAAAPSNGLPAGVTAAMVTMGDSLFNAPRSCNGCHGKGGAGGRGGPDLTTGKYTHVDGSYASIVKLVTDGVPKDQIKDPSHRFPMPARGRGMTDAQIAAVAAYAWTLGHHQ